MMDDYQLSIEREYRSRGAWKLIKIESWFGFFSSANSVLDLCASPGGWMQVAVEKTPVGSLVIGVDECWIPPVPGALSVQKSIEDASCMEVVEKLMMENGCSAFELVLHDGDSFGHTWTSIARSQNALVVDSLKLATKLLAPKGTFVTTVYRSDYYHALHFCLNQLFENVEVTQPVSTSEEELYVVCLKYKAPAKIDPDLLCVDLLLKHKEPPILMSILRGRKQKRRRDGYEDEITTLGKPCSAAYFVWSDYPGEIIGSVSSITFEEPACLPIKDHTLTTEKVKALCDNIHVLGKQAWRHLLEWRTEIRKVLSPPEESTCGTNDSEENEDEKLLADYADMKLLYEIQERRREEVLYIIEEGLTWSRSIKRMQLEKD